MQHDAVALQKRVNILLNEVSKLQARFALTFERIMRLE